MALEVVIGNAADAEVLFKAGITDANELLIAIPEGFEAGEIVERARALNPEIVIFARAHSDEEVSFLNKAGANHVIMGEREIASKMLSLSRSAHTAKSA